MFVYKKGCPQQQTCTFSGRRAHKAVPLSALKYNCRDSLPALLLRPITCCNVHTRCSNQYRIPSKVFISKTMTANRADKLNQCDEGHVTHAYEQKYTFNTEETFKAAQRVNSKSNWYFCVTDTDSLADKLNKRSDTPMSDRFSVENQTKHFIVHQL